MIITDSKETQDKISKYRSSIISKKADIAAEMMQKSMRGMKSFSIYGNDLPTEWRKIRYANNYLIAYQVNSDKTIISIQSDLFKKDISSNDRNTLHNIYLVPVSNHGTLISTTCSNFSEILKVNNKVFSKPKEYMHILKVIYNSQRSLFSNYYFTADNNRVYLSSYVPAPYEVFTQGGKLSHMIVSRLCSYSLFALLFNNECKKFENENFNFFKEVLLPVLAITAKCCRIVGVDWGSFLDFGDFDFSFDGVDASDSGDSMAVSDGCNSNDSYNYNDNSDSGASSNNNGQISFTGTEADHNGKPCGHDKCFCTSCYSGNWDPQQCNHCHHLCTEHN